MKFFTHLLSLVALATAAHGNGWCNQPAFQKYSISSPLLFSCDDSDLKGEVSSLRQEIQVNFEQFLAEIQQLQQACNISAIVAEISQLHEEIRSLRDSIMPPPITPPIGSLSNSASNCSEIAKQNETAATGTYWLSTEDRAVNVTCNFDIQLPPPSPVRGWREIANIDLSNPTNSCPFPLIENTSLSRRCEKFSDSAGCESVFFPTDRVPFSKLCGRAVGYGIGTPDAAHGIFDICGSGCESIDDPYVDGISITYSSENSREHIWTLIAEQSHRYSRCECNSSGQLYHPAFIANDFYCEVAEDNDSPLWEGEGCDDVHADDAPCCENPNLPWFCREFDQSIVTDNIEVRVCTDEVRSNEDIEFDLLKLYTQ